MTNILLHQRNVAAPDAGVTGACNDGNVAAPDAGVTGACNDATDKTL